MLKINEENLKRIKWMTEHHNWNGEFEHHHLVEIFGKGVWEYQREIRAGLDIDGKVILELEIDHFNLDEIKKAVIRHVLKKHHYHQAGAAEELGLSSHQLSYYCQQNDMVHPTWSKHFVKTGRKLKSNRSSKGLDL